MRACALTGQATVDDAQPALAREIRRERNLAEAVSPQLLKSGGPLTYGLVHRVCGGVDHMEAPRR